MDYDDVIDCESTELDIKEEYIEKDWTKNYKTKFEIGDLVVYKNYDNGPTNNTMKITGFSKSFECYSVKKSECRDSFDISGKEIKKAPEESNWTSYYDARNPLKMSIPGLKIHCPSNDKKF